MTEWGLGAAEISRALKMCYPSYLKKKKSLTFEHAHENQTHDLPTSVYLAKSKW